MEGVTKLEVIDNDMELDDIKEEKYFEFLGADEDLDIDDKEQLQITLQNKLFSWNVWICSMFEKNTLERKWTLKYKNWTWFYVNKAKIDFGRIL